MRISRIVAVAALVSSFIPLYRAAAQSPAAPPDFLAARQAFTEAGARGDKGTYAKHLAPDVSWVDISGGLRDRDALLADVTPGGATQLNPIDAIVYPDVVIATGVRQQNNSRFIQVWAKESGTWRLVAHHGAPIGSAPPAENNSPQPAPVGAKADRDAVVRNLNAIDAATEKGDAAALAALVTARYIRVGNTGVLSDRPKRLADIKANGPGAPAVVDAELSTRIHGRVAVTVGRSGSRRDGSPFSPSRRTVVHIKEASGWLEAASINTRIVPVAK